MEISAKLASVTMWPRGFMVTRCHLAEIFPVLKNEEAF